MEIARIITQGDTQMVLLPQPYRFEQDEVLIDRIGDVLFLLPKDDYQASTAK